MKGRVSLLFAMVLLCSHLAIAQSIQGIIVDGGSTASNITTDLYANRFREISAALGYSFNVHRLKSSDGNVVSTLESIRCGANDIFIVIYAGHGANADDGWPGFSSNHNGEYIKIGMTEVVEEYLNRSNARLKIIAFDCCNHGATTRRPNTNSVAPPTSTIYRLLFAEARGLIKVCSSDEGRYSWEAANYGGFFSNSFLASLKDADCIGNNATQTWQLVAEKTKNLTNEKDSRFGKQLQNPKFLIQLGVTTARGGMSVASRAQDVSVPSTPPSNTPDNHLPKKGIKRRN